VAAKLYGEPQAKCAPDCKACDALEEEWECNVSQVLAALKVLEASLK
jgi:hypothetical protein